MSLVATFPRGVVHGHQCRGSPLFRQPDQDQCCPDFLSAYPERLRHLDYLAALTVTPENAGTLLALAQEFEVQEFWYGGDRPNIQSFWELRNMLGDSRKEVKNLSLAPLTREIGGAVVRTRQLTNPAFPSTRRPSPPAT